MKKIFSFAAIALFSLSVLFTACSNDASKTEEEQAPAEETTAPAETPAPEATAPVDTTTQAPQ